MTRASKKLKKSVVQAKRSLANFSSNISSSLPRWLRKHELNGEGGGFNIFAESAVRCHQAVIQANKDYHAEKLASTQRLNL